MARHGRRWWLLARKARSLGNQLPLRATCPVRPGGNIRARISRACRDFRPLRRFGRAGLRFQEFRRRNDILPVLAAGEKSSAKTGCRRPRKNGRNFARTIRVIALHLIGPLQSNKAAEAVRPLRRHRNGRPAENRGGDQRRDAGERQKRRSCTFRSTQARSRRRRGSRLANWARC